jgi:tungstate transport system ATP-binding protein
MTQNILAAQNLKVVLGGATLLQIDDFALKQGETVALVGPNGSGKSTFILTLAALIKPAEGEIIYKGQTVDLANSTMDFRRKVAMVFQEALLFDTTVLKNVASGLKIRGVKSTQIRPIAEKYMKLFRIDHLYDRSAKTLSGGEAQRTSLARALAMEPEILFLDEPFAALDPPTRESLVEDLDRIISRSKTTTVIVTHDRMEAMRLSDRIAVMKEGKILQFAPPNEIVNQPSDEFVASFVGVQTILEGKVTAQGNGVFRALVSQTEIEGVGSPTVGQRVVLFIRPESVRFCIDPSEAEGNRLSGRIEKMIPLGFYEKVVIDCGFPLIAYITEESCQNQPLVKGGTITVSFKPSAVRIIRAVEPVNEVEARTSM